MWHLEAASQTPQTRVAWPLSTGTVGGHTYANPELCYAIARK